MCSIPSVFRQTYTKIPTDVSKRSMLNTTTASPAKAKAASERALRAQPNEPNWDTEIPSKPLSPQTDDTLQHFRPTLYSALAGQHITKSRYRDPLTAGSNGQGRFTIHYQSQDGATHQNYVPQSHSIRTRSTTSYHRRQHLPHPRHPLKMENYTGTEKTNRRCRFQRVSQHSERRHRTHPV